MTDAAIPTTQGAAKEASASYRAWVLFILVVVYTFNFLDRQIVSILAVPIKADLNLSDKELGLMGGLAFAILYTLLGIPIAWLADRKNRVWIMTAALAVWSLMTAVCGATQNFWQLFMARVGVGVGEAGGVAPAYSLIADYFPPSSRSRALATFSFGIPIGSALGVLFGGVLASILSWRAAFVLVGLAGLCIVPLFRLTVREPVRGGLDAQAPSPAPARVMDVARILAKKKSFWGLSFAAAASSMMGYGLLFWIPSFLVRSFGDKLPGFFSWLPSVLRPEHAPPILYASYFFATTLLFGGLIGLWFGGVLADHYGRKNKAAYALVPAFAFVATIPFYLAGVLTSSLTLTFFMFLFPTALSLVWLGPVTAAFQHLVKPNMRATASALFLFINNLIGLGLGNYTMGVISDALKGRFGAESLRYAIMTGSVLYVVAAVLFFITAPRLKRDWEA